jgi:hypothetical protein
MSSKRRRDDPQAFASSLRRVELPTPRRHTDQTLTTGCMVMQPRHDKTAFVIWWAPRRGFLSGAKDSAATFSPQICEAMSFSTADEALGFLSDEAPFLVWGARLIPANGNLALETATQRGG